MRITSRLFKGTSEDIVKQAKMVWFPPLLESLIIVEDILEMARRRQDLRYAFFDLQIYLVQTLQKELLHLQNLRHEPRTPDSEESLRFAEQFSRMTINALEQAGNGIAYRFFDFNHTLVQSFWRQQTSSFNVLSEGFRNSLEVAAAYNDQAVLGRQVLLSDLNNLITLGDIVVKDSLDFEIVEVKANKNASGQKISRQKAKVKQLVSFLMRDAKEMDGREVEIINGPARTHKLAVFAETLERADKETIAIAHVSNYLSIGVLSANHCNDDQINGRLDEALSRVRNGRDSKSLWTIPSTYHRDKPGLVAPLPIYPISNRHVAELLFGKKVAFFCLDLDAIEERLKAAGWNVAPLYENTDEIDSLKTKNPDGNVFLLWEGSNLERNQTMSIDHLYSCAVEMIDIDSYVQVLRLAWDKGADKKKRHTICFYEDESHLWL